MSLSVSLKDITFSGGESVSLEPDSVVVLVGPNNVGKSASLREIVSAVYDRIRTPRVIQSVGVRHSETVEEFREWLEPFRLPGAEGPEVNYHFRGLSHGWGYLPPSMRDLPEGMMILSWRELKSFWTKSRYPSFLADHFFHLADATSRFQAADPAPAFDLAREAPAHPIHRVCIKEEAAHRLIENFKQAFGQDLIINLGAGATIPLHCGQTPVFEAGEDRVSPSYLRKLAKVPLLQDQGDGMRSFAGVLLQATVIQKFVVLIDEPEAFLHPPQARLLGSMLAKQRPAGRQLVIATHSGDLVRGLLDAAPSLQIIRLSREADLSHARKLDAKQVKELWNDPILRFSNCLDGLFHEQVVLCEGDGDCRFYSAMLDAVQSAHTGRRLDIMFTSTGGKHKIPTVASALASIGVPTRIITDFDVLNDVNPLRKMVEALGGSWTTIEPLWKQVKNGIEKRKAAVQPADHLRDEIQKVLGSPTFPDAALKQIESILKRPSSWDEAKRSGLVAVPAGQERLGAEKLLETLQSIGLFVVDTGSLESFDATVGSHGPAWVSEVLEKDLRQDPHLEQARRFVRRLLPPTSP